MIARPLQRALFASSALLAPLGLSGCFARVVGIEQFTPTAVVTGQPHELVSRSALSPTAMAWRLTGQAAGDSFIEVNGGTMMLRVDRRETGLYACGLVVPFLPMFGAFAEPEDWDLVIHVYYDERIDIEPSLAKVRFDGAEGECGVAEFERYLDVWPPPLATSTPMEERREHEWTKLELAFGATYADGESFEVELDVSGASEVKEVVRVRFERRHGSYWDTGFYGGPPRMLSQRRMEAKENSEP